MSSDELCGKLWNEVNDNKQYYETFLSGDTDIQGVDKYIAEKQYNANCADIILLALYNAIGKTATVYQYREDCVIEPKQTREDVV